MSFFSTRTNGFIQLCLVIIFIVGSFAISAALQSKKADTTTKNIDKNTRTLFVETKRVTQQPHRITFTTTGIVESLTDISIVPQVSGRVVFVNANFFNGGVFSANEELFTIDPRDFELEVERLGAEVTRANTALQLEQAESTAALTEWKQRNGKKKAPDLVARLPQMEQAKANVRAADAQLKNAQLGLERTTFTLPFGGRVKNSTIAIGRHITGGQEYGQVFNLQTLEVRASLESKKLQWLLDGENIDIDVKISQSGHAKTYEATLNRGVAFYDPNTRFATANFGLKNAIDVLPGAFATIEIQGPLLNDITLIPSTALQKGDIIWAVNSDNTLTKIAFDMVYSNDEYMAIRGLDQSLNIVTNRLDGGADGMAVNVSDINDDQGAKE